MVAPRTRAERPAEFVPAARPARNVARRPAPDDSDASGSAGIAGANGANGATIGMAAPSKSSPRPKKDRLQASGDHLIASVLKYDHGTDVDALRRAFEFAIEAHGDQKRAS